MDKERAQEIAVNLVFCLFQYFPFGGLQRDFKHIAQACQSRGHVISVYTTAWEGDLPSDFRVSLIPVRGVTNHQRIWNYSKDVNNLLSRQPGDFVVGFNKMHGLDVYYAADPCYQAKVTEEKGPLYRLGPRYRTYLALEKAVFETSSKTHVLLISERERTRYVTYYRTPEERLHSLPPGISRDRALKGDSSAVRREVRQKYGVKSDEFFLLMVGSSFKTKGLDRSLLAMAALPENVRERTKLFVIGEGKTGPFENLAKRLKVAGKLQFLGGRDDVPQFMIGADLLLHPAYTENTGTVLIEAMSAGLPVLATDVCGYASHVSAAESGLLISSPYLQKTFDNLLREMLFSSRREIWKRNGIEYFKRNDFFSMPEKAAVLIESIAINR
jgi:UDP-glucose:(heptosyl)LPS alpha-1,3-glucosyltransferase